MALALTSVLRIDAPTSSLRTLEIREPFFHGVELTNVPKLERLFCDEDVVSFHGSCPAVRFGHVPCLDDVYLSTIHLRYYYENPRELFPAFSNLRAICLNNLATHRLVGTLFILQAAPLLKKLSIKVRLVFFPKIRVANTCKPMCIIVFSIHPYYCYFFVLLRFCARHEV